MGCVAMVCWLSSSDAKRSIRGALGLDFSGAGSCGAVEVDVAALDSEGLLLPFVILPPFFFASFSARYCRLLMSKSLSFRYSSSEAARLVGACLILGISSLVECS